MAIQSNMSNWEDFKIEVNEFLEANGESELKRVIEAQLSFGESFENERKASIEAIKRILRGKDGSPFKRGQKSELPASVRINIDSICNIVEENARVFYSSHPVIAGVMWKHESSGGGIYDDVDDYIDAMTKRIRKRLTKMYKKKYWDGSIKSLEKVVFDL